MKRILHFLFHYSYLSRPLVVAPVMKVTPSRLPVLQGGVPLRGPAV
ncbi:hypothetical protein V9K67_11940 [Paraflavisolibacter sp. H34]